MPFTNLISFSGAYDYTFSGRFDLRLPLACFRLLSTLYVLLDFLLLV